MFFYSFKISKRVLVSSAPEFYFQILYQPFEHVQSDLSIMIFERNEWNQYPVSVINDVGIFHHSYCSFTNETPYIILIA